MDVLIMNLMNELRQIQTEIGQIQAQVAQVGEQVKQVCDGITRLIENAENRLALGDNNNPALRYPGAGIVAVKGPMPATKIRLHDLTNVVVQCIAVAEALGLAQPGGGATEGERR